MWKGFAILLSLSLISLGYYFWFYLPNLKSSSMEISDIHGDAVYFPEDRPYILCYIQSWCMDCVAETPCLMSFSKENNIPVYFVTDETEDYLKRYRSRFDYELPIFFAKKKFKEAGILQFPSVYLYDVHHRVVDFKQERVDSAVLSHYLSKINRK